MAIDDGEEGAKDAKTRHDLWMDPFVTAVDRLSECVHRHPFPTHFVQSRVSLVRPLCGLALARFGPVLAHVGLVL